MTELTHPKNSRVTEFKVWPKPVLPPLFGVIAESCYPVVGETGSKRHD